MNFGKNINDIKHFYIRRNGATNAEEFNLAKNIFSDVLSNNGYNVHKHVGNYMSVDKQNESNMIYFAYHKLANSNYAINKNINDNVDYFAFFDTKKKCAYMVSANKVREYCKNNISKTAIFGNRFKEKILIPDEWAKAQNINTVLFMIKMND